MGRQWDYETSQLLVSLLHKVCVFFKQLIYIFPMFCCGSVDLVFSINCSVCACLGTCTNALLLVETEVHRESRWGGGALYISISITYTCRHTNKHLDSLSIFFSHLIKHDEKSVFLKKCSTFWWYVPSCCCRLSLHKKSGLELKSFIVETCWRQHFLCSPSTPFHITPTSKTVKFTIKRKRVPVFFG